MLLTNAAGYHSHALEHGEIGVANMHLHDDHDFVFDMDHHGSLEQDDHSKLADIEDMHSHAVNPVVVSYTPIPQHVTALVVHHCLSTFNVQDGVKPTVEPHSFA